MDAKSAMLQFQSESGMISVWKDEMPADYADIMDALRSVIAPLKTWKHCAIEYFKRGNVEAFEAIINDIVDSLKNFEDLRNIYQQEPDHLESLADIFLCLAAKELMTVFLGKDSANNDLARISAKKCAEYLSLANEKVKIYELSFLTDAFRSLVQGELRKAEDAFRFVYDKASRAVDSNKKRFVHVSLLGFGLINYGQAKYSAAADYFSRALLSNPYCDGSVRTALANCYYRMGHFDKCLQAADRGLLLMKEEEDALPLLLTGLVHLHEADQDRSRRKELRRRAFESFLMAKSIDPTNSTVLNLLANQYFFAWFPLRLGEDVVASDVDKIVIRCRNFGDLLQPGNVLKIGQVIYYILDVVGFSSHETAVDGWSIFQLQISPSYDSGRSASGALLVEVKNLVVAKQYAEEALLYAQVPNQKSEVYFVLGKLFESQQNRQKAYEFYRSSIREKNDFAPSSMAVARILFQRREYKAALDIFEKLVVRFADDRDINAYVALLKGLVKAETTPFEKLKDIAAGFEFDLELWTVQAFIRHNDAKLSYSEETLRCYLHSKDCYEARSQTIPVEMLNNIAMLYLHHGKFALATDFIRHAILASAGTSATGAWNTTDLSPIFLACTEFENLLFRWTVCQDFNIFPCDSLLTFTVRVKDGSTMGIDEFRPFFEVGSDICVGELYGTVKDIVDNRTIKCNFLGRQKFRINDAYPLLTKEILPSFHPSSIIFWYNYACILDARGDHVAAEIVFREILSRLPKHEDVIIRLSDICTRNMRYAAALELLERISSQSVGKDVEVAMGNIFTKMHRLEDARKSYDKSLTKNRKDPHALLSMGNYFLYLYDVKKQEESLRLSYKYFHPVLCEHIRNLPAANGLGIVCARRGSFTSAIQIFSKIRQNIGNRESTDVLFNLAIACMGSGRLTEAERLFMTAYRESCRGFESTCVEAYHALENASYCQFRTQQFNESHQLILRAWHAIPNSIGIVHNIATMSENRSNTLNAKTIESLDWWYNALRTTEKLLSHCAHQIRSVRSSSKDRVSALRQIRSRIPKYKETLVAIENKRINDQQDSDILLQERVLLKQEQQQLLEKEKAETEDARRSLALRTQERLQTLHSRWSATNNEPPESGESKSDSAIGKRKRDTDADSVDS